MTGPARGARVVVGGLRVPPSRAAGAARDEDGPPRRRRDGPGRRRRVPEGSPPLCVLNEASNREQHKTTRAKSRDGGDKGKKTASRTDAGRRLEGRPGGSVRKHRAGVVVAFSSRVCERIFGGRTRGIRLLPFFCRLTLLLPISSIGQRVGQIAPCLKMFVQRASMSGGSDDHRADERWLGWVKDCMLLDNEPRRLGTGVNHQTRAKNQN